MGNAVYGGGSAAAAGQTAVSGFSGFSPKKANQQ